MNTTYQKLKAETRLSYFRELGADASTSEALLAYCSSNFKYDDNAARLIADEPFVSAWKQYQCDAGCGDDLIRVLQEPFVQWRFALSEGISNDKAYIDVTRRFASPEHCALASGHGFANVNEIQLMLYESAAGTIPVIVFASRCDFEYAWLALTNRNEPGHVAANTGAVMIAAYNNNDRIQQRKSKFLQDHPSTGWPAYLKHMVVNRKEDYQDKFILISPGPYSNVSAAALKINENDWPAMSVSIRIHHEAAHYYTRRLCGSMNSNLLDEIIADYMGIASVADSFKADWFLRFMGFDRDNNYVAGGRMENYIGDMDVHSSMFSVLQKVLISAACNLQLVDRFVLDKKPERDPVAVMTGLVQTTLDELASADGVEKLLSCVVEHNTWD